MDHAEALKSMLQDIINDRNEQAETIMHYYFVSKTREVAGLAPAVTEIDDDIDTNTGDDE